MKRHIIASYVLAALILATAHRSGAEEIARITNLYDAFGAPGTALTRDWGFAALVEYGGKRVLFDTGNDAEIFERNIAKLDIDLTRLDAVVISHRHGDHTSGLEHPLSVNPDVTIYVPREGTSELGFKVFLELFKERFDRAGLGAVIDLPPLAGQSTSIQSRSSAGSDAATPISRRGTL